MLFHCTQICTLSWLSLGSIEFKCYHENKSFCHVLYIKGAVCRYGSYSMLLHYFTAIEIITYKYTI